MSHKNKTRIKDRDKKLSIIFMALTSYLGGNGIKVNLKAGYGISTFPEDAEDLPELLAKADALMFEVKNKGKNAIGV